MHIDAYLGQPFIAAWRGKAKLIDAVSLHYLAGGCAAIVLAAVISSIFWSLFGEIAASAIGVAIIFPWVVWAHVVLWRCAFNTKHATLGYLVRGYVLVAVVTTFVEGIWENVA